MLPGKKLELADNTAQIIGDYYCPHRPLHIQAVLVRQVDSCHARLFEVNPKGHEVDQQGQGHDLLIQPERLTGVPKDESAYFQGFLRPQNPDLIREIYEVRKNKLALSFAKEAGEARTPDAYVEYQRPVTSAEECEVCLRLPQRSSCDLSRSASKVEKRQRKKSEGGKEKRRRYESSDSEYKGQPIESSSVFNTAK